MGGLEPPIEHLKSIAYKQQTTRPIKINHNVYVLCSHLKLCLLIYCLLKITLYSQLVTIRQADKVGMLVFPAYTTHENQVNTLFLNVLLNKLL